MDDLTAFTAFCQARLDEDEAAARACQSPSPWCVSDHPAMSSVVDDATGAPLIYNEGSPTPEEAAHIARHDPARVLREVAAKRAVLLALYATGRPTTMSEQPSPTASLARLALRHMAAVWSDHPDYKPEWAVG
jgi:hypothetical protein